MIHLHALSKLTAYSDALNREPGLNQLRHRYGCIDAKEYSPLCKPFSNLLYGRLHLQDRASPAFHRSPDHMRGRFRIKIKDEESQQGTKLVTAVA